MKFITNSGYVCACVSLTHAHTHTHTHLYSTLRNTLLNDSVLQVQIIVSVSIYTANIFLTLVTPEEDFEKSQIIRLTVQYIN